MHPLIHSISYVFDTYHNRNWGYKDSSLNPWRLWFSSSCPTWEPHYLRKSSSSVLVIPHVLLGPLVYSVFQMRYWNLCAMISQELEIQPSGKPAPCNEMSPGDLATPMDCRWDGLPLSSQCQGEPLTHRTGGIWDIQVTLCACLPLLLDCSHLKAAWHCIC